MKIVATMAKTALMAVLCISVSATADRDALATESAKTASCASPVYRQFDFWIGDWDAFDVGEPSKMVLRGTTNQGGRHLD